jgi:hypothetical protein
MSNGHRRDRVAYRKCDSTHLALEHNMRGSLNQPVVGQALASNASDEAVDPVGRCGVSIGFVRIRSDSGNGFSLSIASHTCRR